MVAAVESRAQQLAELREQLRLAKRAIVEEARQFCELMDARNAAIVELHRQTDLLRRLIHHVERRIEK